MGKIAPVAQRSRSTLLGDNIGCQEPYLHENHLTSRNSVIKTRTRKGRTDKGKIIVEPRDSVDMVIESLLHAHDFDGLRHTLHNLGLPIPATYPNEIEIPEDWALLEYKDHYEVLGVTDSLKRGAAVLSELSRSKVKASESPILDNMFLILENALRKRDAPFVRTVLFGLGFDISLQEDKHDASINDPQP